MPTSVFNGAQPGWRLQRNRVSRIPVGSSAACLQWLLYLFFITAHFTAAAQTETAPVFKGAIAANRSKTYINIIKNTITKNLSLPLTDSTEENWQDAFYAMEVLQYKQPWCTQKIAASFSDAENRSPAFQRALLECAYALYPNEFIAPVQKLWSVTGHSKIFALCAEYLYQAGKVTAQKIQTKTRVFNFSLQHDSILNPLVLSKQKTADKDRVQALQTICGPAFLPGHVVLYSFQRKNRNYPGKVLVRNGEGSFIKDTSGNLFSITQLARSVNNLPFYLTNGNTPQGLFRMNGFAVSRSAAIGPTENVQLMMPYETSPRYFLKDSTITDTVWNTGLYECLLPEIVKKYQPLLGTYYASAAGRTEIIAHGTTVDPSFYKGQTYYPLTPTQGCLCTKEIWSDTDGKRTVSDQQKLVDAVKKAGGANGYCVVIEMDDQQKPVSMEEILQYVKAAIK